MKKNAFTLLELLGVIVILAVIALLSFPPILEQVRKSKKGISDASKELIFLATSSYVKENNSIYSKTNGNIYCITVKNLVESRYLKEPVVDPDSGGKIDLEKKIEITVENNEYKFKMNDECTSNI